MGEVRGDGPRDYERPLDAETRQAVDIAAAYGRGEISWEEYEAEIKRLDWPVVPVVVIRR